MKQYKTSEEAIKIFESMRDRFSEFFDKLVSGNWNMATRFVYETGFIADIDNCLKELKIKRTITKIKNVQEIEVEDIEKIFQKMNAKKITKSPKRRGI